MKKTKIGRNDPCPCGAKKENGDLKKYKHCCLKNNPKISPEVIKEIVANIVSEPFEKGGLLTGRRFVEETIPEQNIRFRAVGNKVYRRSIDETFHIFLFNLLSEEFDGDWYNSQILKTKDKQHPIFEWIVELNLLLQKTKLDHKPGEIISAELTGNLKALLSLSYDFYSLKHCNASLLPKLLKRLKNNDQFQGARYEIAVAGLAVRSGFDIEWANGKGKHCEFIGTHKLTKEKIAFEAKSHSREGILGKTGKFDPEKTKIKIFDHIREALEQGTEDIPLVIFDDLNIPISEQQDVSQVPWFTEIDTQLKHANFYENYKDSRYGALFITNFSWYFHAAIPKVQNEVVSYFHIGGKYSVKPDTIRFLQEASRQYGFVPAKAEELSHLGKSSTKVDLKKDSK